MNTLDFGMGFGMWVFWFAVIAIVVFLVRLMMTTGSSQSGSSLDSPLQILEKRYARGEINEKEFEAMKKELEE